MDRHSELAANVDAQSAQLRTVRVGGGDVDDAWAIVEGLYTIVGSVDELITDDEVAGLDGRLQTARGRRRDQACHAELGHRPQVGAVVDRVGRDAVASAVPGQK